MIVTYKLVEAWLKKAWFEKAQIKKRRLNVIGGFNHCAA
jgi:hypothetical protein